MYITPNNANIYYINLSMLKACPVRDEFHQENIEQPSRNRHLKEKKKRQRKIVLMSILHKVGLLHEL